MGSSQNPRGTVGRQNGAARLITALWAAGTIVALFLAVFAGRSRPGLGEAIFGLLNIPVAPSFLSVVVLALVTRALVGRKRIGWWAVVAFQVFGIYLGMLALLPPGLGRYSEVWRAHGSVGRGLDIAGIFVGAIVTWWLWRHRKDFPARLQPGSWWAAAVVLIVGLILTVCVTWLVLGAVAQGRDQMGELFRTVLAAFGGVTYRPLGGGQRSVADLTAILAGLTILAAALVLVASARPRNQWSPERELSIRRLLADSAPADSLGYFATRRDKSSVFSPDGRAAITYRVLGGVSLASGDPVGDRAAWPAAVAAWRAEAREFGWEPAVISASEDAARVFTRAGMRALQLGDEAILTPSRFDLATAAMTPVRRAVERAERGGLTVQVRRQSTMTATELEDVVSLSQHWLSGEPERGFSMALNRSGDPSDEDMVYVSAHDSEGIMVGVLGFVPWGAQGVSLDVMRRSPHAPNGVTELMVNGLMAEAPRLGISVVSLNFCMFRGVFEESARLGAPALTRLNARLLSRLDRFWQLERLYRANEKYRPEWLPRFLCYDDAIALPQVAVAAGAAEGFVPWPRVKLHTAPHLDEAQLARAKEINATSRSDLHALAGPRRGDQTRHRLAILPRIRAAGLDPYPHVGEGELTTMSAIADLEDPSWGRAQPIELVGRVRSIRDHGGVVFADLQDGPHRLQALFERGSIGADRLALFTELVATGDLVRIIGSTGRSRTATPSVLADDWRFEAKSLQPMPRAQERPDSSAPATDRRLSHRTSDLLAHPDHVSLLRQRSQIIAAVRHELSAEGYLEVETPMLQSVHGGATARPFETHSNAYGSDLYLRIAPELFLKQLVIGGMGPIFELGRAFRNEGADATHNPEFTTLEVYRPHADHTTMRLLTERLIRSAARAAHGDEVIPLPEHGRSREGLSGTTLIDISGEWPVVDVLDAVSQALGESVDLDTDFDHLMELAKAYDVSIPAGAGPGGILEELYADLVEARTMAPTFYVNFPIETSPLTRPHRERRGVAERWDLVVAGMELGTAYTELTDPIDQRERLTAQSRLAAAGDPEAMQLDEDFLHAIELGMPPTGGLGIGIDRLVMLLTNQPIRSILAFPFVRR